MGKRKQIRVAPPAQKKSKDDLSAIANLGGDDDEEVEDFDDGQIGAQDDDEMVEDFDDVGSDDADNMDGDQFNYDGDLIADGEETDDDHEEDATEKEARSQLRKEGKDYSAPTPDEMLQLRETQQLFKSNLFRLQIQEMVSEIRVDYDKTTVLQSALEELRKVIQTIPVIEKATGTPEDYAEIQFHDPDSLTKGTKIHRPEHMKIIGSYDLKSVARPNLNVDVAIRMPKEIFGAKDIKKGTYFDRRNMYLVHLARHLRSSKKFKSVMFQFLREDRFRPILVITPAKDTALGAVTKFVIRIFLTSDPALFKDSLLAPTNLNSIPQTKENKQLSSPYYNTAILNDMLAESHHTFLQDAYLQHKFLNETLLLCKVWARQKSFGVGTSWNNFLSSMLLVHLLRIRKITQHMSSYQAFRFFLAYLAEEDILATGIFMKDIALEQRAQFSKCFPVVFVDPTGKMNMAAHMTADAIHEVQMEAKISLAAMDNSTRESFTPIFMEQVTPYIRYDYIFRVNCKDAEISPEIQEEAKRLGFSPLQLFKLKILEVVEQGLEGRVTLLRLIPSEDAQWKSTFPKEEDIFSLGLLYNGIQARSLIINGPSGEQELQVEEFKKFWGKRAEIRRFKDGRIIAAVVFSGNDLSQGRQVLPAKIIAHLLQLHFKLKVDLESQFLGTQFDRYIQLEPDVKEVVPLVLTNFNRLSSIIRSIEELPLRIDRITPIDPCYKHTQVIPLKEKKVCIQNNTSQRYFDAVIEFERSSAWPRDDQAIKMIKAAFYVQLDQNLHQKHQLVVHASEDCVLITFGEFTYRLTIHYQPNKNVQKIPSPGTIGPSGREFSHEIAHTTFVHSLHMKHTTYGPTVRLALRWLHCHMFSEYFTPESVELMVAYLFTGSSPPSENHAVGFLRWLDLLVKFDFETDPLIIDVDGDLTVKEIAAIEDQFMTMRSQHPDQCLIFTATPRDLAASVWTKDMPTKMILTRIIAFAKQSRDLVEDLLAGKTSDWSVVFKTSLADYNLIIDLNQNYISNYDESIDWLHEKPVFKKRKTPQKGGLDYVVEYVKELKARFGDKAMFFYDALGGKTIGVVWKPSTFAEVPFKLATSAYTKPVRMQGKSMIVTGNLEEMIADMQFVGGELVRSVKRLH
eukprot:TRINITY_DN3350_c0_g1_i1.p1 TRINITY_DN3350_c0_g1~~TRINITY_DN3350_c0_g1_i1.p1  ORF type:complete len:1133 (-),score=396.10 TRINITY_DN3350_c0_g1_i1:57-3455(-)